MLTSCISGCAQVYKRVELSRSKEEYQLWGETDEEPRRGEAGACLKERVPLLLRGKVEDPSAESKRGARSGRWW
jgi:hypothetical protein